MVAAEGGREGEPLAGCHAQWITIYTCLYGQHEWNSVCDKQQTQGLKWRGRWEISQGNITERKKWGVDVTKICRMNEGSFQNTKVTSLRMKTRWRDDSLVKGAYYF